MRNGDMKVLPARQGKAIGLTTGQSIQIINTHGSQAVDCWAFNADDTDEYMSMRHSRNAW